ncbi:hypothetical protein [Sphingomonas sp. NIBR02145]|uniref:hypothetical protein n=1 Tax=Sphingomonas sp. NIBR02145 TaxID=3014784 RepID=UPI0022B40E87|nr:hypothetical protein [Sphingomonas sp. NIBR02145]WHU00754.1 hypothetical protein O3305_11020 [Sphingomonas sp. NIBR02145]
MSDDLMDAHAAIANAVAEEALAISRTATVTQPEPAPETLASAAPPARAAPRPKAAAKPRTAAKPKPAPKK